MAVAVARASSSGNTLAFRVRSLCCCGRASGGPRSGDTPISTGPASARTCRPAMPYRCKVASSCAAARCACVRPIPFPETGRTSGRAALENCRWSAAAPELRRSPIRSPRNPGVFSSAQGAGRQYLCVMRVGLRDSIVLVTAPLLGGRDGQTRLIRGSWAMCRVDQAKHRRRGCRSSTGSRPLPRPSSGRRPRVLAKPFVRRGFDPRHTFSGRRACRFHCPRR